MKTLVKFVAALGFGLLIGIISALWMAGLAGNHRPQGATSINVDNWASDWDIGSQATTPYMRAYIAKHGLLALPKSEAVYFMRTVDDKGRPLVDTCTYEVSGGAQMAQWWSITLYDEKNYLPANDSGAYSVDHTKLGAQAWTITVQQTPPANDAAWLSTRNAGKFDLMIRLYKPAKALLGAPEKHFNPPSIRRLNCQGGGS